MPFSPARLKCHCVDVGKTFVWRFAMSMDIVSFRKKTGYSYRNMPFETFSMCGPGEMPSGGMK